MWCDQWLLFFAVCLLSINKHHAALTAASSSSHTQSLSLLSPSLSFFLTLSCTELVWLYTKTFSVTTGGYLLIIWVICSSGIRVKHQAVGKNRTQWDLFMSTVVVHVLRLNFSECFNQMLKTPGIFLLVAAAFLICCFRCSNGNSSHGFEM